jgi:cation/acetate symporter
MIPDFSWTAVAIFGFFVAVVLGISFYLGSKAKSAQGYFAAHGQVHWFVNGVAFAGDYLSAASFLGICGMIAFYGYDGFLYSIGYLAGWIVALFVIAEPLKRLGKYTFADALDNQFHSRGIKLAAAVSTLVVSVFYLIPQMVGAGTLIKPLLGLPHAAGVVTVGVVVIVIVVTAGMVSTTWVQFIKGTLLVFFCAILTVMILNRGLSVDPRPEDQKFQRHTVANNQAELTQNGKHELLPADGPWEKLPYVRLRDPATKKISIWRKLKPTGDYPVALAQYQATTAEGTKLVNGFPHGRGEGQADFRTVGQITKIRTSDDPASSATIDKTGPLGPLDYFATLQRSDIVTWERDAAVKEADGSTTIVYYPREMSGSDLLIPGGSPTFKGVRSEKFTDKLDFLSLMLALFCGTASLPHILIRYYTVKDGESARKSTVVGIASIGFFYVLTLYLGLGAMTSGALDPTNTNMAAPLLARSFGEWPFAVISAIAFTTVLGTVSGLILAAAGAVAHDLASSFFNWQLSDHDKIRVAKLSAVVVGGIAMVLGIIFEKFNVTFLVGWAFNVAASANLPSLVMLLFWPRTTKQGITAAIWVGMITSLGWILLSAQAYKDIYGLPPTDSIVPFSQPGIVTIPLGFLTLIVVSLLTPPREVK